MRTTILFSLVILSGLSVGALAANQVIHQQGRVFSSENVSIKKGGALTFVNDDTIPHNIMSATKGSEFNLGSQAPGIATIRGGAILRRTNIRTDARRRVCWRRSPAGGDASHHRVRAIEVARASG